MERYFKKARVKRLFNVARLKRNKKGRPIGVSNLHASEWYSAASRFCLYVCVKTFEKQSIDSSQLAHAYSTNFINLFKLPKGQ